MKKLMTVFIIVLVLLASGMTALVVLFNPNDFRSYLAQQIAKRSGYQLALEGDLRWHVWPQLSVIAGQMSLTVPGAKNRLSAHKICV
ncbi:AsmA family protein [Candidatus Williamhamiltonella defendens]|uniref:AsmA family protein n=1 Tax=Candidatus Williamhamiltonella defendens TaxID=138072 RepID=UPI001F3F1596|nr:AsmA family protein [Candidatus Hamiltonella defensa]